MNNNEDINPQTDIEEEDKSEELDKIKPEDMTDEHRYAKLASIAYLLNSEERRQELVQLGYELIEKYSTEEHYTCMEMFCESRFIYCIRGSSQAKDWYETNTLLT